MYSKKAEICSGLTLIEILVALAIVVILAVIAYPSYQETVRKGKRTEGRAALMQLMQQQELYYSRHNSYIRFSQSSTDEQEKKFKWYSGSNPKKSAYEIKAEACKDDSIQHCVLLTATPGTENVDPHYNDPVCGELTLTSAGVKSPISPDCWK